MSKQAKEARSRNPVDTGSTPTPDSVPGFAHQGTWRLGAAELRALGPSRPRQEVVLECLPTPTAGSPPTCGVSVTDRCNLRCAYCMPAEGLTSLPRPTMLTDDEVVRLARIGGNCWASPRSASPAGGRWCAADCPAS